MRKTLLLILLLMLSAAPLTAKKTDPATARRVAINFFYERVNQHREVPYRDIRVSETFTEVYKGVAVYYAFNLEGSGYVVVSADDAVTPVLAYSFDGRWSRENQPPQLISWMEGYAKQIDDAVARNLEPAEATKSEWARLAAKDPSHLLDLKGTLDVAPMIISTWDQGAHYNMLCPADAAGPGGHVYAGCVATAMSQVMYYYRYPQTGDGQHCYNPSGYAQQCADFGATTYEWNEMMNAHNSTKYNDTAMATLLWHAGISVDMMYSPGGSGAYSEDATAAMISNFRYHPNTSLKYKSDYTEDAWAQLLRENLDQKRPMYYHGFGSGGHAFNVDGYQGTNYFHFNWGWSGSYNGYYYLTNLNPGGSNFTEGQGAIVNLYPDTLNNTYPYYCTGQTELTGLSGTFEDGSGPTRNYIANANCSWLVIPGNASDSVTGITLNFNQFSTETGSDILKIFQGETTSDQLIGEYSGDNIPGSVFVEGSKALITFTTNGTTQKPGWFISYVAETMDWCNGTQTLTDPQGDLSDGSFDFNYKNKTVCRWKIIPEGTGAVMLTFTAFKTQSEHDILSVYDLGTETLIAELSGDYDPSNLPGPVTASSGKMYLIFSSDNTITSQGWEGFYTTFPVGCEEIAGKTGLLAWPNPADDVIRVAIPPSGPASVQLFTISGTRVWKGEIPATKTGSEMQIDVSEMNAGLYLLKVTTAEETMTRKIMIR